MPGTLAPLQVQSCGELSCLIAHVAAVAAGGVGKVSVSGHGMVLEQVK